MLKNICQWGENLFSLKFIFLTPLVDISFFFYKFTSFWYISQKTTLISFFKFI